MPADAPTIVATSGGLRIGRRSRFAFAPLVEHAVELSGTTRRPKLVHLGTAAGDQRAWNAELDEAALNAGWDLRHLNLFAMPSVDDPEALLLDADVVWVGGGSVVNLLAVWRAHALDEIFRRVWQAGVVLGGVSAGSICWHVGGTTDSYGPQLRAVTNGLALLPYGNGVHYDSEAERRPLIQRLVAEGVLPTTHCTDDGVGLVYRGTDLVEAVSEVRGKGAYTVTRVIEDDDDGGRAVEERLEPRVLPGAR
ncbi:Peptidase E [Quadrisphaera granulorum]|uniref:Peptidase E n=1 Tax=Quadrisphaera granulorum TaxID=317664 RepID=A0A316AYR3_9ACTN|nr:peptidase E [Quadrisphaera granulorum]PWJ55367.1 peptidase E [Quadrisphaera granulorum]SZE95431.1 Peptidase E [Quadrisphaera granulorum]